MDTSTIQRAVQQVWAVDENGDATSLLSESPPHYGCVPCGMSFGSWETTAEHCQAVHSPEGIARGNGFTDTTGVATFHQVSLEPPGGEDA